MKPKASVHAKAGLFEQGTSPNDDNSPTILLDSFDYPPKSVTQPMTVFADYLLAVWQNDFHKVPKMSFGSAGRNLSDQGVAFERASRSSAAFGRDKLNAPPLSVVLLPWPSAF